MLLNLREEYQSKPLDINHLDENPITQFHHWFQEALASDIPDANAMTLATCTSEGRPSARIVLLKDYSEDGFTFFTNYESRKGQELMENPYAALILFWKELHRQIRIEGRVEKVSGQYSKEYFQSRPKGSQIGAWASPQSRPIDRETLERKVEEIGEQYADANHLPLPSFWGGYVVIPNEIEFWQGRPSRLHDRFRYFLQADKSWEIKRLAP
ncbi:MAG: pyridoxamine 5'-phosphate oxidase [Lewinellaceae bacterium]|nr:pyridoxamine 5'-phosphate oxidase [Saprospiraceae bacterium]MCB9338385.1 pyridoxamine 5'-phosphate oxidase [Lewinellaceae bacterium]